ncbi:CPBP family glutamic-type intramembrane protease [Pontibacter roseus]|uniref:CPBP family glutamic-type intramembrane protease n=1 Tax=Pontibacter roseus TaxID=336989 RepID=UPI00037D0827|nr:CPBP family glutamic-type intramembrane protease [Pontibacter roseus]
MLHTFTHQLKQTGTDIWAFLRNPKDQPAAEQSAAGKIRILLLVLLIDVIIVIGISGLVQLIEMAGWYSSENHAVVELLRKLPIWAFLLLGVLAIPLLEELVFRYGLRFKIGYISFEVFILVLTMAVSTFQYLPLVWALGTSAVLTMALVLYFLNVDAIGNSLERVWPKVYGAFFYTVAFLFGLIHITNFTDFDYASAAILLIPIIVAPQIFGGLLMGYMRVKHGFFWGYFLHAGHNALFFGLALATMGTLEEKLNIQNDGHTLQVEEHIRFDETAPSSNLISHDSVGFDNQKLKDVILALLDKDESEVEFEKARHHDRVVNVRFKPHSPAKDIKKNKEQVLGQLQKLYKFDISYRSQQMDAWDVTITDTAKLAAHTVADIGKSTVVRNPDGITLENVTMGELVSALETDFKVRLISRRDLLELGKYNFKLPKSGFEQAKEYLKTNYGILLQSRMELADLAVVSFQE